MVNLRAKYKKYENQYGKHEIWVDRVNNDISGYPMRLGNYLEIDLRKRHADTLLRILRERYEKNHEIGGESGMKELIEKMEGCMRTWPPPPRKRRR